MGAQVGLSHADLGARRGRRVRHAAMKATVPVVAAPTGDHRIGVLSLAAHGRAALGAHGRRLLARPHACCRVPHGYTVLKDVDTGKQGDLMPSDFLAETLMYLWLLGTPGALDLESKSSSTPKRTHSARRGP